MYNKELEQMLHSDDFSDRVTAAECAYGLDILVNDESHYIREEVARHGYGLGVLIHDTNPRVRAMVAYNGYGLDILLHDEVWIVREKLFRLIRDRYFNVGRFGKIARYTNSGRFGEFEIEYR